MIEVNLSPEQGVAYGLHLYKQKEFGTAQNAFLAVLKVEPGNADAHMMLGVMAAERKDLYEAYYRFDRAVRNNRRFAMALSNRGMVLGELGHLGEAIVDFQRAIALEPNNPIFRSNLGNTLERMGRCRDALPHLDKAISLDPGRSIYYQNRGIVLSRLSRRREAVKDLSFALKLDPGNAQARYNLGINRLIFGDMPGGFEDYEARLVKGDEEIFYIDTTSPKWAGEPLDGKSILVHAEQGIGDEIQFMRYIPMVWERKPDNLFIISHRALHPLVRMAFPWASLLDPGETQAPHDFYSPLLSLPLIFGTSLETIPPPVDFGLRYVAPRNEVPKVGICWSGNWQHKNDHNRSLDLSVFAEVLDADCAFYSLQQEIRPIDAEAWEKHRGRLAGDLAGGTTSYLETAERMLDLDLVVTSDTSVAHMAGTLGIPTWVLLSDVGVDWRWLLDRQDSPWYPSIRLFRRSPSHSGSWVAIVRRVRDQLRDLAQAARRKAA